MLRCRIKAHVESDTDRKLFKHAKSSSRRRCETDCELKGEGEKERREGVGWDGHCTVNTFITLRNRRTFLFLCVHKHENTTINCITAYYPTGRNPAQKVAWMSRPDRHANLWHNLPVTLSKIVTATVLWHGLWVLLTATPHAFRSGRRIVYFWVIIRQILGENLNMPAWML